jgi:hypothetical protein
MMYSKWSFDCLTDNMLFQNTLDDLSQRVDSVIVKEQNSKLKSENQVSTQYIEEHTYFKF